MGILQYPTPIPMTNGDFPQAKFAIFSDNITTVTTAGYLNQTSIQSGMPLSNADIIFALYSFNQQTQSGSFGIFTVSIAASNGKITLSAWGNPGDVLLPVTSGDFAVFNGTTGQIKDAGYSPSNAAKTKVMMANGSTLANFILVSTDGNGTAGNQASAIAYNNGGISAGQSGEGGSLYSYSNTPSTGYLALTAVANTGNTATVISNAAMGQASTISIPDPGAATANFVLNTGATTMAAGSQIILAKANGTEAANAVTASGNAGVITTSSLTTAGGASYAITWTNTLITTTSVILLTIMGGTNSTQNITLTATAGSGTSTLTIYNNTAATDLNGTILIGYTVL